MRCFSTDSLSGELLRLLPSMSLVLLVGLPAAGKTTLAKRLATTLPARHCELDAFDVESMTVRQRRKRFEEQVKQLAEGNEETLIVDDTLHMRSMRRPFERLARRLGRGFLVVFLPVDVDSAVERDCRRSSRVGEETIRRVDDQMEEPDDSFIYSGEESFNPLVAAIQSIPRRKKETIPEGEVQVDRPRVWERLDVALREVASRLSTQHGNGRLLSELRRSLLKEMKRDGDSEWTTDELEEELSARLKQHFQLDA